MAGSKRKTPSKKAALKYDKTKFVSDSAYSRYTAFMKGSSLLDCYVVDFATLHRIGLNDIVKMFDEQGLSEFLCLKDDAYFEETCQFYANFEEDEDGGFVTKVNGYSFGISPSKINAVLGIRFENRMPPRVYASGSWPDMVGQNKLNHKLMGAKYFGRPENDAGTPVDYKITNLPCDQRIVYEMVARSLVPKGGKMTEPTYTTILMFYYIMEQHQFNPGYTIVKHMEGVATGKRVATKLPYGNLITRLLKQQEGFTFSSNPTPSLYYDKAYFEKKKWILIDMKWAKGSSVDDEDEEGASGDRFFRAISSAIKKMRQEVKSIRQSTWQTRRLVRGLERARANQASSSNVVS